MKRGAEHQASTRPGFALVAVLWVVVIAALILLAVRRGAWVDMTLAHDELSAVQARWLARAGVEQALAMLEDDDAGVDGPEDWWYDDPQSFQDVQLSVGTFSVTAPSERPQAAAPAAGGVIAASTRAAQVRHGLIDHAGLINLNAADEQQLGTLRLLNATQVACILDWIDADDTQRPGGAEAGYYQRMRFPYAIRNGPLQTLRELLLVKDIDEQTFFGEDANLNGLLDANEDDRESRFPPDDGDGRLTGGVGGLLTVYSYELNRDALGNPRINMNSADKDKLVKDLSFTSGLADGVIKARGSKKFAGLMDLLNVKAQQSSGGSSGRSSGGSSDGSSGSSSSSSGQGNVNEINLKWIADNFEKISVSDDERLAGRINVNTAGEDVLLSLPGMTSDAAGAIIRRREGSQGSFRGVGELLNGGLNEEQFKSAAEKCTVHSSVFEVRSTGVTTGGIRREITAVVDRGSTPQAILYWYESE